VSCPRARCVQVGLVRCSWPYVACYVASNRAAAGKHPLHELFDGFPTDLSPLLNDNNGYAELNKAAMAFASDRYKEKASRPWPLARSSLLLSCQSRGSARGAAVSFEVVLQPCFSVFFN
jgi:hypothetical protein